MNPREGLDMIPAPRCFAKLCNQSGVVSQSGGGGSLSHADPNEQRLIRSS